MNLPPVLVLSGGLGSRVSHISNGLPKPLININGVTFLERQLALFKQKGISEVIYSIGYRDDIIIQKLETLNNSDIKIKYIKDGPSLRGTGGALLNALDHLSDEFLLTYGDSYLDFDYLRFLNFAQDHNVCMTIYKNTENFDQSNVKRKVDSLIYYEKNSSSNDFDYIDYGMIYFKKRYLSKFKLPALFDLSNLLTTISNREELHGFEIENRFYEIGSESGISAFKTYLK